MDALVWMNGGHLGPDRVGLPCWAAGAGGTGLGMVADTDLVDTVVVDIVAADTEAVDSVEGYTGAADILVADSGHLADAGTVGVVARTAVAAAEIRYVAGQQRLLQVPGKGIILPFSLSSVVTANTNTKEPRH